MNKDIREISVKEQELLNLYYDGESSFLQNFKVKKLLNSNHNAVQYVESLSQCSEFIREQISYSGVSNLEDFCSNIHQRINNEEHSAIFLGNRDLNFTPESKKASIFSSIPQSFFPWALSATLALVLFINVGNSGVDNVINKIDNGLPVASTNNLINSNEFKNLRNQKIKSMRNLNSQIPLANVAYENLSTSDEEVFDATPYLEEREQLNKRAVKVDWIRGNGSISLIQQRTTRAPLIWISKSNRNY